MQYQQFLTFNTQQQPSAACRNCWLSTLFAVLYVYSGFRLEFPKSREDHYSTLSGYVAYASIKNMVKLFIFYLLFSLIYLSFCLQLNIFVGLILWTFCYVQHLRSCTMSVANCQAQKYLDLIGNSFSLVCYVGCISFLFLCLS